MRKILTIILSLLIFCGCSRQITINFMVKDQIAFSVSGKSPIILNEQNFQIDDEMINLYDWIDEKGTPIDFSQPFKKDTTIYSNATFNYYIFFNFLIHLESYKSLFNSLFLEI